MRVALVVFEGIHGVGLPGWAGLTVAVGSMLWVAYLQLRSPRRVRS